MSKYKKIISVHQVKRQLPFQKPALVVLIIAAIVGSIVSVLIVESVKIALLFLLLPIVSIIMRKYLWAINIDNALIEDSVETEQGYLVDMAEMISCYSTEVVKALCGLYYHQKNPYPPFEYYAKKYDRKWLGKGRIYLFYSYYYFEMHRKSWNENKAFDFAIESLEKPEAVKVFIVFDEKLIDKISEICVNKMDNHVSHYLYSENVLITYTELKNTDYVLVSVE